MGCSASNQRQISMGINPSATVEITASGEGTKAFVENVRDKAATSSNSDDSETRPSPLIQTDSQANKESQNKTVTSSNSDDSKTRPSPLIKTDSQANKESQNKTVSSSKSDSSEKGPTVNRTGNQAVRESHTRPTSPPHINEKCNPSDLKNNTMESGDNTQSAGQDLQSFTASITEKVNQVVPKLLSSEEYEDQETYKNLLALTELSRYRAGDEYRLVTADTFTKASIVDVFQRMWDSLFSKLRTEPGTSKTPVTPAFRNFRQILVVIWNGTDISDLMCQEVMKHGFISIFFSTLKEPCFAPKLLEKDKVREYLIKGIMGILHNIIQHCFSDARDAFREADALNILQTYRNMEETALGTPMLKCKAVLLLAYIITEEEQNIISSDDESIRFLIKALGSAMKEENHKSKRYGFSAVEIISGLNKLALNDENKRRILNCGALPYYTLLLAEDCKVLEQETAAIGIWTLAFDPDNKIKITNDETTVSALQVLASGKNRRVKKAAEGALWVLKEQERAKKAKEESSSRSSSVSHDHRGHVMISYQWASKPLMIQIKDRLKEAGFKVWMDIENMSGSTLEAMAEAVEKASVVIVSMTRKYKESNSCRTEAEYTYKLQKDFIPLKLERRYNPDGWLGIMIGTRLFFDFSKDGMFDVMMNNLIRELIKKGAKTLDDTDYAVPVEDRIQKKTAVTVTASIQHTTSTATWTEKEVKKWLTDNGIQSHNRFEGFTGSLLLELLDMHRTAPEFYFNTLKNDLGLTLISILKMTKALKALK